MIDLDALEALEKKLRERGVMSHEEARKLIRPLPELLRLARIGQKVEAPASQPEGVVVPREPTEKMLMAACRVLDPTGETMWPAIKDAARRYYTAMLAAAKEDSSEQLRADGLRISSCSVDAVDREEILRRKG